MCINFRITRDTQFSKYSCTSLLVIWKIVHITYKIKKYEAILILKLNAPAFYVQSKMHIRAHTCT